MIRSSLPRDWSAGGENAPDKRGAMEYKQLYGAASLQDLQARGNYLDCTRGCQARSPFIRALMPSAERGLEK